MSKQLVPVVQLIDGFAVEEHSGGASQFGIQLARHLDRARYQPLVCGLWRYDTPSERRWQECLHGEGIQTAILVEKPRNLVTDLGRAASLLAELVAARQIRVINSHFERGDLLSLWCKIIHCRGIAIVRTMHTDQQWQKRPWLGALLNFAAFPWLFDGEVAISEATRAALDLRLGARLGGRTASLLYNGLSRESLAELATVSTSRQRVPTRGPRIGIIGRVEQQKGHRVFLRAAHEVLKTIPTAEFWIVGTGSLLDAIRDEANTGHINHAVRFFGQRSDVSKILAEIDLLVSASLWEGFPTVLLEAMAGRVPVVATDVSGSRELIRTGETGWLVPPGQPHALAQAIVQQLRNHDEATCMAERAYEHMQRFSLMTTATGYERLYEDICKIKPINPKVLVRPEEVD